MEKDSPSKPSVAELAGRFKGHILPTPNANDEPTFRRRPPCSLKLQNEKDDNEESDKTVVSPNRFKIKMKNSPIIEKLQANLALSPTALLPSPKSPEVKLHPAPLSPTTPHSPLSPTLQPLHQSSEEEDPSGFDGPPEGNPLPSINKTRARLSFKRRPPTRQHRRSAGEEAEAAESSPSPLDLCGPKENGGREEVFSSPAEEDVGGGPGQLGGGEDEDRDCEKTEDDEDNEGDAEEEERGGQQVQRSEDLEDGEQTSDPGAAGPTVGEEEEEGASQ